MGAIFTNNRNTMLETAHSTTTANTCYLPNGGNYFGTHFIMGGERFESPQPGEYLFGDNVDLNFLGNKPVPFPYPVLSGTEPTRILKSLVYVRKDSLRLTRSPDAEKFAGNHKDSSMLYNIEFVFDSDVSCNIKIHYFATEEISNGQITYSLWLVCLTESPAHTHILYSVFERSIDGAIAIKPLKQKQFVDGLCYLLQEIYGIENKSADRIKDIEQDDESGDSGTECVICMSDMRDTLILPCRHLCLCNVCAESLRFQASTCPICRVKFRALLQIRAIRRKGEVGGNSVSQEGIPPGYAAIPLIEALNGKVFTESGQSDGITHQIDMPLALLPAGRTAPKDAKLLIHEPVDYQKDLNSCTLVIKVGEEECEKEGEQSDNNALTGFFKVNSGGVVASPDRRKSSETGCGDHSMNKVLEARCGLGALEVRLQFSEGDMADDECEGSSTELDADYGVDDAVDGVYLISPSRSVVTVSSGSIISVALSTKCHSSQEMEPLRNSVGLGAVTIDHAESVTEGSSLSSICSGQALLNSSENVDDAEQKMMI